MSTAKLWLLVASIAIVPREGASQDIRSIDKLRDLRLDTVGGSVVVHYSAGSGERAKALQAEYAAAVRHYEEMFAGARSLDVTTRLGLLDPSDWSTVSRRPYGAPHIDFSSWPDLLVILPAHNDRGLMADLWRGAGLTSTLDITRAVDVVGFHEFGHGLNIRYLYVMAPGSESLSVQWFDELMATYLGQGFLWHRDGVDADPLRPELLGDSLPQYTTLADFELRHPAQFQSPRGYANYAWYQAQFASRGRDVFRSQGLDFVRRVREELPWDRYPTWSTDQLLGWLEAIEPGFVVWANAMSRPRKND